MVKQKPKASMNDQMAGKPAVIKQIIEMIEKGESEEKITRTLVDLGISSDEAKKLMMFAEKDVYTLLLSDMNKIVEEKLQEKDAEIKKEIADATRQYGEAAVSQIRADIDKRTGVQKQAIEQRLREFSDAFKQDEKKIDITETMVTELKSDVAKMAFGSGTIERRVLSSVLVILGIGVIAYSLLQYSSFLSSSQQNVNSLIVSIIITIVGAIVLVSGIYTRE